MDPIANMLTSIRNAASIGNSEVVVPFSNIKARLAELFLKHGFLASSKTEKLENGKSKLVLSLVYHDGVPAIRSIRRISKPGLRIYRMADVLPRPKGGFGIVVISTPKGMMTTQQARRLHMGGEIICEVLS